jgi:membrane protease YdiL (CAAX protease family)
MTATKRFVQAHPILFYSVLTFAISWGAVLLMVGPGGFPIVADKVQLVGMAMLLGPTVAGLLSTYLAAGGPGLRALGSRLVRWRVGLGRYAFALLTAPLATAIALAILRLSSDRFTPNIVTTDDVGALLVNGIVAGLFVGIFEELGWTGFAVPQMRRSHDVVTTGLLVGLLWGAWHFILFWEADTFSAALPFALLLARLSSWLLAYRVLMVWLYDGTQSLFVTILMHVSLVASTVIIEPPLLGADLLAYILVRAFLFWVLVGAVVLLQRRTASSQAA